MKAKAVHVGMSSRGRQRVADGLGVLLADTHTLYLTTHGYHWNVTGPLFPALHTLFEQQYNELWLAVDQVAERIRSLDRPAPFGCSTFARQANVREGKAIEAMAMLADLVAGHEAAAHTVRTLWPVAETAGDQATLDLLAARLSAHEKATWMLRATSKGSAAIGRRGLRPART
jgi:starvation-inducible DNA-binding protein